MKWGKNKPSPSSSNTSILTRVFPFSLFSKFKQRGDNLDSNSWQRSELDFPTHNPSYSIDDDDDDDAYSRLFFHEGKVESRRSVGVVNYVCYDSDDEFQVPVTGFKSFDLGEMEVTRREKSQSFDNMVSDIKKMKDNQHKEKNVRENGGFRSKKPNVEANSYFNLEDEKFKEIKVKNESLYTGREYNGRKIKQKSKVKRAYSPRTECRFRVLEDMKRARMKLKKKESEEQPVEGKTVFDSFAVVKSSFNPQQDFKDSMLDMIIQKGIYRPEELEELLACYLTLNCDEYHDLIIKVFRQVWLELNRGVY